MTVLRRVAPAAALACVSVVAAGCNNGQATPLAAVLPAGPSSGTAAPALAITSVAPPAGSAFGYAVTYTISGGSNCGKGLLAGGALILDDGSVEDSMEANEESSGFAPLQLAPGNCDLSGTGAATPQVASSSTTVMHVVDFALYISAPGTQLLGSPPEYYPMLGDAVAKVLYPTNLYLLIPPAGAPPADASGGQWQGAVADAVSGPGAFRFDVVRVQGAEVSGTWEFDFQASTTTGGFLGAVVGSAATLLLTPLGGSCPLVLSLDTSSTPAFGTYAPASQCALSSKGSVNATKQ